MMRYLSSFCLLLIFSLSSGAAEDVRLKNVRIWAAPDNTRVVFDVSGSVAHDIKLLSEPRRVVIDLQNTESSAQLRLAQPALNDKYVQNIRRGQHKGYLRVVLDLKKQARVKSFPLAPNRYYGHRLVVDLYDSEKQQVAIKQKAPVCGTSDVVIAVDAGHGGEDPGAIGPAGTHEKTVVLQIARKLVKTINRERGMCAVLTRTGDYYLPLRRRVELADRYDADLFISIHADAFTNRRVNGSSVYILSSRGASSEHARLLAEQENASDQIGGVNVNVLDDVRLDNKDDDVVSVLIDLAQTNVREISGNAAEEVLKGLKKVGKVHKPRVESAGFAVLKSPNTPSLLVETAFISNPQEEKKLKSAAYQRKLAKAVTAGVKRYFEINPPAGTSFAARKQVIASRD